MKLTGFFKFFKTKPKLAPAPVRMQGLDIGVELIKEFEDCRLKAYLDSAGIATLGYGHIRGVKMGDTCTQEQAEAWLVEDTQIHAYELDTAIKREKLVLNAHQYAALLSFCFNLGVNRVYTLVNSRTLPQVADALLKYVKAGGVSVRGLWIRRDVERKLFLTPPGNSFNIKEERRLSDAASKVK